MNESSKFPYIAGMFVPILAATVVGVDLGETRPMQPRRALSSDILQRFVTHPYRAVLSESSGGTLLPDIGVNTPSDPTLSDFASAILDSNAASRFREFAAYKDGWYFGKGSGLNRESLFTLEAFVANAAPDIPSSASLFMTTTGNLQLSWEDAKGMAVELEFTPTGVDYFIEADDTEGHVPHIDLAQLKQRINASKG